MRKSIIIISIAFITLGCKNDLNEIEGFKSDNSSTTVSGIVSSNQLQQSLYGSRSISEGSNGIPEEINAALPTVFSNMSAQDRETILSSNEISIEVTDTTATRSGTDDTSEDIYAINESKIKAMIETQFFGKTLNNVSIQLDSGLIEITTPIFAGNIAKLYVDQDRWNDLIDLSIDLEVELDIETLKLWKEEMTGIVDSRGLIINSHYCYPPANTSSTCQ